MDNTKLITTILICVLFALLLLWLCWKFLKVQKYDHLVITTGAVKSGKTALSVYLAYKQYKSQLRKWKFKNLFLKLFKKPLAEMPLFYSTMTVAFPYVPLTKDYIERKKRFRYGSVILVDEATLLADSFDFKNAEFNENYTMFNKLIAHETHGGYIFYDTQSVSDLHFAVKRCICRVIYILENKKIPFFMLMKTRDLMYSADSGLTISNNVDNEMNDDGRFIIIPKRVWKKYDCYTYSILTDKLQVTEDSEVVMKPTTLKTDYLLRDTLHVNVKKEFKK